MADPSLAQNSLYATEESTILYKTSKKSLGFHSRRGNEGERERAAAKSLGERKKGKPFSPFKMGKVKPQIVSSATKLTPGSLRFLRGLRPWRSRSVRRYLARFYAQEARDGREEEGLEEEEKVSPFQFLRTLDLMRFPFSIDLFTAQP